MDEKPNSESVTTTKAITPRLPPGFSSIQEWEGFERTVQLAFENRKTNAQSLREALILALKGKEIGLGPMYSLSQIFVVGGKAGLQAEAMRALVYRKYPKAKMIIVTPIEKRHLECKIVAAREDGQEMEFLFTMEDAVRAGLVTVDPDGNYVGKNQSWSKYPQDMLTGRATSRAVRFLFPECVMGIGYVPEELHEIEGGDNSKLADLNAKLRMVND